MREHLRAATFRRSLIDFRLCDFSTATLAQADTPTRKPWRSDQGNPRKNRPDHAIHARTASGHAWTRATPTTAHRSPQTGASAAGYTSPATAGTAHRGPRETPYTETDGTQTPHASAGKPQGERKIKPGEITPGKRKCSTEPPRRRHANRAGGRQQGSKTPQQGRTPTRAKRNPPEALPPAGMNYLSRALSTAPKKIIA